MMSSPINSSARQNLQSYLDSLPPMPVFKPNPAITEFVNKYTSELMQQQTHNWHGIGVGADDQGNAILTLSVLTGIEDLPSSLIEEVMKKNLPFRIKVSRLPEAKCGTQFE